MGILLQCDLVGYSERINLWKEVCYWNERVELARRKMRLQVGKKEVLRVEQVQLREYGVFWEKGYFLCMMLVLKDAR